LIATGARILVPFKKPLQYFFSKNPVDTHPVNFSFNSLRGILASTGFEMTHVNQYIDNDIMIMIARKTDRSTPIVTPKDDWRAVTSFFDRWHKETQDHYKSA
jgi:hypothetical protein